MLPADSPKAPRGAPLPDSADNTAALRQRSAWLLSLLALLMVGLTAAMAWALDQLLRTADGPGPWAAPLAASAAVALVGMPLLALVHRLLADLRHSRARLVQLNTIDSPTGVPNRSHFLALAEREWARARRYGDGGALLLIDIDRFGPLCESRGAGAGDAVLRALAANVNATLRGADAMARFGGAQLAVWLAQADPLGALDVAERIRERTESLDVPWQQHTLRATVSVGVAALRPAHGSLQALVDDAEAAAQAARQTGGNCVRAAPVDPLRLRKIGPSVGDNQVK